MANQHNAHLVVETQDLLLLQCLICVLMVQMRLSRHFFDLMTPIYCELNN